MRETITATVQYVDLEGGFWGLVGDNGESYEPIDMPADMQRDGLHCSVTVSFPDVMTTRMWGVPVKIIRFEILS